MQTFHQKVSEFERKEDVDGLVILHGKSKLPSEKIRLISSISDITGLTKLEVYDILKEDNIPNIKL